ncbi:DUF5712 family protein [Mucilaginibacter sp. cycad4]|uniref:DUF5712 family protein n=1 Tax=Mucilaginibacter sp. cycad4 TaxID=3342096 RepID=UPI002AAA9D3C|nr:DUF5712 family protein [Mucilaginibacter gossypii]WPV02110.1 DUF5712 family protein [Mucilaginibacter gossypii]
MFINITDSETADNKGSSRDLVHYLDKENRLNTAMQPELWFNGLRDSIPSDEARTAIDRNVAKLGKNDAKFFLVNISPSKKELAHLIGKYGEDGAKDQLKAYTTLMMDEYAQNFKRPGIEDNSNLLWFAKLENYRYFSHKDPEVKQGIRKRGERKEGDQMHIQVIVSRKDITNSIKLSPMNKSRGKNVEHSKKVGQFDRSAFKTSAEKVFDSRFEFDRGLMETFRYHNVQKNGSLEQRLALDAKKANHDRSEKLAPVAIDKQIKTIQEQPLHYVTSKSFLQAALAGRGNESAPSIDRKKRKRRNKGQQNDQGLNL